MTPSSVLSARGLMAISPGPLLGSTLAFVLFWAMRHSQKRRLSWNSTPLPPRGYRVLPPAPTPVRVEMTVEQPTDDSAALYDWAFAITLRFHGKPWVLHRSGRPDVLVVSSPAAFEDIQRTFAVQFERIDEGLSHDVHGGAIASVCTGHRPSVNVQRQLAARVLTSPALRQQASTLVEKHVDSLLKALEDTPNGLDMTKLVGQFTMEVFTELGFGLQLGSTLEKAVDDIQEHVRERANRSTVVWRLERLLDVGREASFNRSVEVVRGVTLEAVEAKRRRPSDCSTQVDMLDLLLSQKCSSKSSKESEFLAQFVLSLVVAARDSLAHTLAKCFQCLAENPVEQEKLVQDLKNAEVERKEIHSVVRLEAVVKETLRLYPAKSFVLRRAKLDAVLSDGTFIEAGAEVAMDLYSMARRENVWGSDSAQFRPQRWIDSTTGKLRPVSTYKFNAFLGGPRTCLGADIALKEVENVVAAVLSNAHLEAIESDGKMPYTAAARVRVRQRSPQYS